MKCRLYIFLVWLLALVTVTGQTPAPTAQTGTITGRVVNENGEPLANAKISVFTTGSMQHRGGAITDRDGKFQVSGLDPRSYQVIAWLNAYASVTPSANYRIGDSVTLVLTKGGVITGTVTTQTGEPVVGVRVHARMIRGGSGQLASPLGVLQPERPTDDRGIYRIYGLRPGTYVVWAGGDGNVTTDADIFDEFVPTYAPASVRDTAAEISVHAGEEIASVDIHFRGEPGHIVSGRVSQPAGAQPANFALNLTAVGKNKSEWTGLTVQTDDSPGFMFRGVDDGDYDLTALSFVRDGLSGAIATKRIKVSGADVTGIEFAAESLASVSGRIVLEESNKTECTGKQRPSFGEMLVSASLNESQAVDLHPQLLFFLKAPASVDASGNLSLKILVPGRYFFVPEFAAKYWYLQSITLPPPTPGAKITQPVDATRAWTTLKSGDRLSGLTITLAQGGASLSGKVSDNVSTDLFLYLVPAEKERAEDALRFFGAAVGTDGKVTLNSLPPGSYWVLVKSTEGAPTAKLRFPDQKEMRASLRREAEAAKTTIELKPCQHLTGFPLKVN